MVTECNGNLEDVTSCICLLTRKMFVNM